MSPVELAFILLLFALPVVAAIACAKTAKGKGYNEILFGLLGFFFTIFALILILVLPDRIKPREAAPPTAPEQGAHADS